VIGYLCLRTLISVTVITDIEHTALHLSITVNDRSVSDIRV